VVRRGKTYVVRTGQLLERLHSHAQSNPIAHSGRLEHLDELADWVSLDLLLGFELGIDFFQLGVHGVMMSWGAVDFDHCLTGFVSPSSSVRVAGRFVEEENANAQDDQVHKTNADDNAPAGRAGALVLVGAKIEAGGEEDSQGDEELISGNESTSNPGRSCFGFCVLVYYRCCMSGWERRTLIHWD
jgi:hypothetical protein